LSFTPVKNGVQKLNPAKTSVDLQQVISPHPLTDHHVVIVNSVELNILFGKMEKILAIVILIVLSGCASVRVTPNLHISYAK